MRNDLRRDRKLPGFFDKEVYDILDSGSQAPPLPLALPSPPSITVTVCKDMDMDSKRGSAPAPSPSPADPAEPHLYDSNRSVPVEDGLFSDFEQDEVSASPEKKDILPPSNRDFPAPIPLSGSYFIPFLVFQFIVRGFFFLFAFSALHSHSTVLLLPLCHLSSLLACFLSCLFLLLLPMILLCQCYTSVSCKHGKTISTSRCLIAIWTISCMFSSPLQKSNINHSSVDAKGKVMINIMPHSHLNCFITFVLV